MRILVAAAVVMELAGCEFRPGTASPDQGGAMPPDQGGSPGDGALGDAASGSPDARGSGAPSDGSGPTQQSVTPSQDSWLRQQYPDDVEITDHIDGESSTLRTGAGSSTGRANRLILAFDLGALPAGCQISAATVNLYFFQDDFVTSPTLSAHRVTAPWSATSATWNTPWASGGGDFDSQIESSVVVAYGVHGWVSWDVQALAVAWRSGAKPNYGVEILQADDNSAGMGRKQFESSRASSNAPYLAVTCQ